MNKPYDEVGNIIAFEDGRLDEEQTVELFQHLIDSGQVWTLQGSYGHMAQQLITMGKCHIKTRDGYIAFVHAQRRKALGWLRRQGVPLTEAEIMTDRAIESMIAAFDKTGAEASSLIRRINPWLTWYKQKAGTVVPVSVEVAEKFVARGGRTTAKRGAE